MYQSRLSAKVKLCQLIHSLKASQCSSVWSLFQQASNSLNMNHFLMKLLFVIENDGHELFTNQSLQKLLSQVTNIANQHNNKSSSSSLNNDITQNTQKTQNDTKQDNHPSHEQSQLLTVVARRSTESSDNDDYNCTNNDSSDDNYSSPICNEKNSDNYKILFPLLTLPVDTIIYTSYYLNEKKLILFERCCRLFYYNINNLNFLSNYSGFKKLILNQQRLKDIFDSTQDLFKYSKCRHLKLELNLGRLEERCRTRQRARYNYNYAHTYTRDAADPNTINPKMEKIIKHFEAIMYLCKDDMYYTDWVLNVFKSIEILTVTDDGVILLPSLPVDILINKKECNLKQVVINYNQNRSVINALKLSVWVKKFESVVENAGINAICNPDDYSGNNINENINTNILLDLVKFDCGKEIYHSTRGYDRAVSNNCHYPFEKVFNMSHLDIGESYINLNFFVDCSLNHPNLKKLTWQGKIKHDIDVDIDENDPDHYWNVNPWPNPSIPEDYERIAQIARLNKDDISKNNIINVRFINMSRESHYNSDSILSSFDDGGYVRAHADYIQDVTSQLQYGNPTKKTVEKMFEITNLGNSVKTMTYHVGRANNVAKNGCSVESGWLHVFLIKLIEKKIFVNLEHLILLFEMRIRGEHIKPRSKECINWIFNSFIENSNVSKILSNSSMKQVDIGVKIVYNTMEDDYVVADIFSMFENGKIVTGNNDHDDKMFTNTKRHLWRSFCDNFDVEADENVQYKTQVEQFQCLVD